MTNLSKSFILASVAMLSGLPLAAQTGGSGEAGAAPTVTVNGQPVSHVLASMTFEGDNVVLHFSDADDLTADMQQVAVSLPLTTGIEALQTYRAPQVVAGSFRLGELPPGTRVAVYDTAGRRLMQTTTGEGPLSLPLDGLRQGVYVVRAGNHVIKVNKR